jgi:hypothetical protein
VVLELSLRFHMVLLFFGVLSISRIAVHISVCSLVFWGPLYFQKLCTFVYVLFVLWILSIFRIALYICMWSTWSHHCYSWMSDLWWPNPHSTPLTATKQHVVNSLSLSLCASVQCWFMGQVYSGLVHGWWFLNFYEASFQLYIAGIRTCGEREGELF